MKIDVQGIMHIARTPSAMPTSNLLRIFGEMSSKRSKILVMALFAGGADPKPSP